MRLKAGWHATKNNIIEVVAWDLYTQTYKVIAKQLSAIATVTIILISPRQTYAYVPGTASANKFFSLAFSDQFKNCACRETSKLTTVR